MRLENAAGGGWSLEAGASGNHEARKYLDSCKEKWSTRALLRGALVDLEACLMSCSYL